ncbi:MAG: DUF929 family protein [Chloroflexota bacterium]|nr:DUF929 family protein [Chloroflexota bacterium]
MSERAGTRRARRAQRQPSRGPRPRGRSVWRGPLPIVAVVAAVVVVVGIFVAISRQPAATPAEQSPVVNSAVVSKVTSVPASVFDQVGAGTSQDIIHPAPAGDVLKGASGKPLAIYVGAEFCPYCASERWSFILALSRFGTWNGLALSRSSSTDVFPNTPTFTFRNASYASDYLELSAVETSDREGKPIASMTPTQDKAYARLDSGQSIPFIDVGDRFYSVGAGYAPDVLSGKSWDDIAAALRDPSSAVAKAVLGHANKWTAAICAVTGGQPGDVCSGPAVKGIQLPTK